MLVGFALERALVLTPKASKTCSVLLLYIGFPALIFASIVGSISTENITESLVIFLCAFIFITLGVLVGLLILVIFRPRRDLQYTTILFTSMGNWGNLPLAVLASLDSDLFTEDDKEIGVAYVFVLVTSTQADRLIHRNMQPLLFHGRVHRLREGLVVQSPGRRR
jgi:predicted permease